MQMFKYRDDNAEGLESFLQETKGNPKNHLPLVGALFQGRRQRSIMIKAFLRAACVSFVLFSLFLWFSRPSQTFYDEDISLPPRYAPLRKEIAALPQHNLISPLSKGPNRRYIKFSSQISQLGWNNVLNELLLNAHLAYRSNRAYVFMDYGWKEEYYPWPRKLRFEHPPRTPLAALLGGPVAGAEWPEGVRASMGEWSSTPPRAIYVDHFNIVCPPRKRRIIRTDQVKGRFNTNQISGREVFDIWLSLLTNRTMLDEVTGYRPGTSRSGKGDGNDDCLEIVSAPRSIDSHPQVFDLWLWGSDRILSLWEEFKASPVASVGLGVSEVVERCVERNMGIFGRRLVEGVASTLGRWGPLEKTLAVHVRRGDFKEACQFLADWNSTYYSWNQLPFLPDKFTPPPYAEGKETGDGNNSETNVRIYQGHCLPDDEHIVKKVQESRRDWEAKMGYTPKDGTQNHYLETVFLLTNEVDEEWLGKLRSYFLDEGGWKNVVISSLEVVYGDAQEKDVGMAVDMELARRAAVFVGNGFSSFTSNILHRRLVDEKAPISNRFF